MSVVQLDQQVEVLIHEMDNADSELNTRGVCAMEAAEDVSESENSRNRRILG